MGDPIQHMGAYAPATGKTQFEISKYSEQKFHAYISTFYVCTSSFTKK
jgi:hypothetical protein